MDDCRTRPLIFSFIYLCAYSILLFTVVYQHFDKSTKDELFKDIVPIYEEKYKTKLALDSSDGQSQLIKDKLTDNSEMIFFAKKCVIAMIVLMLFRLYISMELFDSHEYYYHKVIKHLTFFPRCVDWLIRFAIAIYIILLAKFNIDVISGFISKHIICLSINQKITSLEQTSLLIIYIAGLFFLLLLWDVGIIVSTIFHKLCARLLNYASMEQMAFVNIIKEVFLSYITVHFLGLASLVLFLKSFSNKIAITTNAKLVAITCIAFSALNIVLVLNNLLCGYKIKITAKNKWYIPKFEKVRVKPTMYLFLCHFNEKFKFIRLKSICKNTYHLDNEN